MKTEFAEQHASWRASLHPAVRSVIGHVQLPLLQKLANDFSYPDMGALRKYSEGHPLIGEVPYGGNLTPKEFVADSSVADLAATARARQ